MLEVHEIEIHIAEEIAECSATARELLHVEPGATPLEIVSEINAYIGKLKADRCQLEHDDIVALAALLGDQYVAGFAWHWAKVMPRGDDAGAMYGVLTANNAILITPFWWVNHVMSSSHPSNFLHNFKLVAAGKLPKARPGQAVGFH